MVVWWVGHRGVWGWCGGARWDWIYVSVCGCGTDGRSALPTTDPLITKSHPTHTTNTQLLSPSMYTEMSRFDPIGAGFMLSIDDDGFFTVSSDPRVRLFYVFCSVSPCVGYGVRFIMGCARWAWVVV